MIDIIEAEDHLTLADYASYLHLRPAVEALRAVSKELAKPLKDRTVWMVNSAAQGGGVAEMLPKMISMLCELGVDTRWAVIGSEDERFFKLTKRLHNLLHGTGDPHLTADDRALYEAVSRDLADAFREHLRPNDLLVVHDPQPLGMGALLKQEIGLPSIWRCHIGFDQETPETQAAWDFLRSDVCTYDCAVFSLPDYVPSFMNEKADIINPAIDPLSHKNRELPTHKFTGILTNASLATSVHPCLTPPFEHPARRLQRDGSFAPATEPDDIGLLFRPIVTQVSRWDRLKGFEPLLQGFVRLKAERHARRDALSDRHRRRLDLVRLVLAGPDPASVQDDPEGLEVFEALSHRWQALDPELQHDIAILVLPMASRKYNALMVNALQRCSTVVVQNSLREGFGLTATEAMWKARPVLGTHAAGLRAQIEGGAQGHLVQDPEDPDEVAAKLDRMLEANKAREAWARNARLRVGDRYLVFTQLRRWLEVLSTTSHHA